MSKVLIAGSINMDIVAGASRHPAVGETVAGQSLAYYPGGKGANQAVAAAQLGARTHMIGRLGDDAFAEQLREFLVSKGVDISAVSTVAGDPSGTALIVVAGGENSIVVIPGANDALDSEVMEEVKVSEGDVILAQFETPQETTRALFERGRAHGATSILNPAPAAEFLDGLLQVCDVVVVNETELASIARLQEPPASDDHDAIAAAIYGAMAFEDQRWIVTLGAKGAIAINGRDRPLIQAGHPVEAVDSTGAGDCFVGALAAGLAETGDMTKSLIRANAAAALSVQRNGAGPSMPTARQVDEFLATVSV